MLYKNQTGNPNASESYITPEGYRLGGWQRSRRDDYKKGRLSPDRSKRLEEIGFTWNLLDEQFEKGFQDTLLYKERTGDPNTTKRYITDKGYNLGLWQITQRSSYKKGILSSDRIKQLEEIGFKWETREDQFKKGFQETLIYKERTANPNAPRFYKTSEGYKLGNWQHNQMRAYKKGFLSSDRIKRLEEIGFTWEILEEKFEKGFQETLLYKERTGTPNAPDNYKTDEGYILGSWQSHQRTSYRKGNLSKDRIKLLEEVGFTWERLEEQFEKGLQETLLYKNQTGNPNAPSSYKTAEGYRLGVWQTTLKGNYERVRVSKERIKRLEDIGFIWGEKNEDRFEKGFQETLLYKERTGTPNAPYRYETPEGYRLGHWQGWHKLNYMKGKLSPDRIKRLEDIGFKWGKRR